MTLSTVGVVLVVLGTIELLMTSKTAKWAVYFTHNNSESVARNKFCSIVAVYANKKKIAATYSSDVSKRAYETSKITPSNRLIRTSKNYLEHRELIAYRR